MNVQYRATLISIDGRILTEGSRVDCQSRTSRRRGRISPWQGNRELHLIPSFSRVVRNKFLSTLDFQEFDTETLAVFLDFREFKSRV